MKKIKFVLILALAVGLFCALGITASAADLTVLSIDAPASLPEAGETFTVTVSISNNPGLCAAQYTLAYDQSVVRCKSIKLGTILNGMLSATNLSESTGAVVACAGASAHLGDGVLSEYTFVVLKSGTPNFLLSDGVFTDAAGKIVSTNVPAPASAFGTCGENATWELIYETGALTISGSGTVDSSPWKASNVQTVMIDSGITGICSNAFENCSNLTDVYITDLDAWCRIDFDGLSANPMYYAKNIYLNNNKIVSVTVPSDAGDLAYTFYGFKDLIKVTISEGVASIGDSAFCGCSSLTKISISNGVISVGANAFKGCSSLISVAIPVGVKSIGKGAFYGCSSLATIIIPEGVTNIGDSAFYRCYSLESISIPNGVTSIGEDTFYGCSNLTSVTLPESVKSIGYNSFGRCCSLTSIDFPKDVKSIASYAFRFCSNLTSVTISKSLTSIGESAFSCCDQLSAVYISDITSWCKISFDGNGAHPLQYGGNLYLNGVLVEALEIPEDVQVISSCAFYNATCIKTVALPKSLVGVAANAFNGCCNIKKVIYAGSESEWNELAISSGNDPLTSAERYYNSTLDNFFCRITAPVCDGGRLAVSTNAAQEGDTVTVAATPYEGYQLDGIYLDGETLDGNTFTVSKNHTVTAAFSLIPIVGGTQDDRLNGITVTTAEGEKLQDLTATQLRATVSVTHLQGSGTATVMLAEYDSAGRYAGLLWLTLEDMPEGATIKATLPVDNTGGKICYLKAFVVGSLTSPIPIGNAVTFGKC